MQGGSLGLPAIGRFLHIKAVPWLQHKDKVFPNPCIFPHAGLSRCHWQVLSLCRKIDPWHPSVFVLNPVIFCYVKTEGKTEYALTQAEATRIVVQILK